MGGAFGVCQNLCCSLTVDPGTIDLYSYCTNTYTGATCRQELYHYTGIIDPDSITCIVTSNSGPAGVVIYPQVNYNLNNSGYVGFSGHLLSISIAEAVANCYDGSGECIWNAVISYSIYGNTTTGSYTFFSGAVNIDYDNGNITASSSVMGMCSGCGALMTHYNPV